MSQIIYPKYAGFIVAYAIIFLFIGVSIARGLDKLFPKFNKDKRKAEKKHKLLYLLEIAVQISLIAVATYIFREVINHLFSSVKAIKSHMYGNPDKFAALIIAPTMFSVQPNLIEKIKYVWGL